MKNKNIEDRIDNDDLEYWTTRRYVENVPVYFRDDGSIEISWDNFVIDIHGLEKIIAFSKEFVRLRKIKKEMECKNERKNF